MLKKIIDSKSEEVR